MYSTLYFKIGRNGEMIEKREKEREVSEGQRRWKVNVIKEKKLCLQSVNSKVYM